MAMKDEGLYLQVEINASACSMPYFEVKTAEVVLRANPGSMSALVCSRQLNAFGTINELSIGLAQSAEQAFAHEG